MKLISTLIAATALTIATPAQASEFTEEEAKFCATVSETAELIMKARQEAITRRVVTEAVTKDQDNNEIKNLWLSLVELAFARPRFTSEKYKQEAISDFSSDVYSTCYKSKTED